ncbi:ninja-family protein AFP3-like [Primulina huaijiensis]|uniref:ninja-family protein AFP3-like n=1 Tax=Primulina huaijiensis TaxID=1492673 RepID=UPI003CC71B56
MDGYSNALLKNEFMSRNRFSDENVKLEEEEDGEIELSLGLSMNGRFGVDPERKKLRRACSISNLVFAVGVADNGSRHKERGAALEAYAPLARTCSLPTQAEEWRHRKVLESTRSMEARKKRMEKLKNVRMLKDTEISTENGNNGNGSNDVATVKDNVRIIGDWNLNLVENVKQTSQGSIGSQRSGGSSGISDGQSQPTEGAKQLAEVKSSSGSKSVLERNEQKATMEAAVREAKGPNISHQNVMQEMPLVSTKAYGPNGTKVDGFLYRYKKGEDVRIVCVCHGMFLSPAEFVKHGGGGSNVEHPLKHIVVNPSPLL